MSFSVRQAMNNDLLKKCWMFAVICASAHVFGCTEDGVSEPEALSVVWGSMEDFTTVVETIDMQPIVEGPAIEIRLTVDGRVVASADAAPFILSWNTTATKNGAVQIALEAEDAQGNVAESESRYVVVLNGGAEMELMEGNMGQMSVPADFTGEEEIHLKHHWLPEQDYNTVLAVLTWAVPDGQSDWEVELKLGSGTCPHTGQEFGDGASQTSPLIVELAAQNGWPKDTQYFSHIDPTNAMNHKGESAPYEIRIFVF